MVLILGPPRRRTSSHGFGFRTTQEKDQQPRLRVGQFARSSHSIFVQRLHAEETYPPVAWSFRDGREGLYNLRIGSERLHHRRETK